MKASTQVLTKKVGPCGGDFGTVKDMNINGVTRILKVDIHHSDCIHALTITFLRNGLQETERWGTSEGTLTVFHLQASEYITSVKGHFGINSWGFFMIKSLKFETNLQNFGPYGEEGDYPFELTAIRGQIIGFHGRSSADLYALGVYVQEPLGYTPQSTNATTIPSSLLCSNFSRMASNQVLTKKIGPCGGNAETVRDMNINGITHILKISIHHSSVKFLFFESSIIDALSITFLRNGREESTELWGIKGSGTFTEFSLHASEYITLVKGHIDSNSDGVYVRSLKFKTNLRSYGPYGKEGGASFELPAITGKIIGFHGRSGASLNSLGVYVQDRDNIRELEDCKQKLEHTEVKYLRQFQKLKAELDSKLDLQKKLESKIESLEIEDKLQKTEFKHKEAEYLKQLQGLSSSKDDLQKKLESKTENLEKENKLQMTEFKHKEAEHLKQLQGLSSSKDDLKTKLESKIEYLENKNELLHTKFKHTEVEYLMHSQELRAQLDNKDDIQKKLESKIKDLESENELMQTKEKDYKDAIKELLQSRESFVHHYEADNMTGSASDGWNTGGSTGTGWAGTK